MFDAFLESVNILSASVAGGDKYSERQEVRMILEDVESPVTRNYVTKLYDAVVSKAHIDFDDIPNTKGDIKKYKGYENIKSIIATVINLAETEKVVSVKKYAETINSAILRMESLSDLYEDGFMKKNDYVMLEYNTYVYAIVQATSSLLYEFVDYIKNPQTGITEIKIKNTNRRPSLFYINQLEKFNSVTSNLQYRQFITNMINKGRDNFIGVDTAIGIGAVTTAAIAIVPITRELVYQFYNVRAKASDYLLQQAYFIELNKARLEASSEFDSKKRKDIIMKQENARKKIIALSEKLRVDHIQSQYSKDKMINSENSLLTLKHVKKDIEDTPLTLM